jgi:hypothetical protein
MTMEQMQHAATRLTDRALAAAVRETRRSTAEDRAMWAMVVADETVMRRIERQVARESLGLGA